MAFEIVQSVDGTLGAGSISLPDVPTVGNTIYVLGSSRGDHNDPPDGFTDCGVGEVGPVSDAFSPHYGRASYRVVQPGDTAVITWVGGVGHAWPDIVYVEERVGQSAPQATSGTFPEPLATRPTFFGADVTPPAGEAGRIVGYAFMKRNTGPIAGENGWTTLLSDSDGAVTAHVVIELEVASASGTYTPDFLSSSTAVVYDGNDYGAITLAIFGESPPPPPPDPGIEVGVYDPDGVFIADITDAFSKSIRVELDGTGQGTFSINRQSSQATATNLAQGNLVKVTYPAISADPIFAWFMDEGDFDLVSTDEEGGEDLVFAGQGALSYLGRAIMWDRSFLESLNHVLLGPGSRFIYTKSGSDLVSRTSTSFAVATLYSAGADETLDFPPGGSAYNDRTYVPITSGPHTGKYVSTKWLTVPFVGDGSWRLFASGSGTAPGQILRRIIEEAQTIDRPQYPLAAMTVDFDYTDDSDGNAWDDGDGVTDEFTAQVGEDVLAVTLRLIDTGKIDVQMDPDLGLHAYNSYGRNLTSATFAADKVRFVRGVNVADILRRSVGLKLPATHALVDGDDAITATAELGVIGQPVVETYISLEGSDPTVLAAAGEAILLNEYGHLESVIFPIAVGDDPENGRYLPGPPGTNGHFWVGDTVTVDTGDTTLDYSDTALRVMALSISEDEAGNIDCIPELAATINPAWWRNRLTGRGGTGGRIIVKGTPRTEVSGTEGTQISPADVDLSDYATDADLAAHTGDAADAHDASAISFAPAGSISATDVQAAIEEIATEALVNPMTTPADLIVGGTAGAPTRLAKGSDGDVLTVDPTTHLLVWAAPSAGSGDVATDTIWDAKGDLAGGTGSDTAARLPIGSDGDVLTADSGETTGMKWAAPTGGSGSGTNGFALDIPPSSAHASDDEFPGSSLDAKWTDPLTSAAGQTNTIIVANGAIVLEPATAGTSSTGKHVFGIRQNAPAGDFSVFGRLGEKNSTADIRSGIFVGVVGGKAHVCGNFRQDHFIGAIGVSTYSESADWSGFDGFLANYNPNFESWSLPAWVRIRWVSASSTLFFDYSMNGIYYENFSSRTSMTQPDRLGICIYSNSGTIAADAKIAADFFRVTEP